LATEAATRHAGEGGEPDPNAVARSLFRSLPARYDALGWLLSFGQDRRWRAAMVAAATVDGPGAVLDVATGTAGVALALTRLGVGWVVGADLSPDMLSVGRRRVAEAGAETAGRVQLVQARAEQLPFRDGAFDALTFTYLLRYVADSAATLAELARVVRPAGRLASLEFFVPPRRGWRALWWLYSRAVLPVAGLLTGGRPWWRVGRFLGPSISGHYRRHPLAATLHDWAAAGVTDVGHRVMSVGGGVVIWGRRAGA
jgi:demethylmenaquinone methyltransferase/2-methoxy-6-polyprenyl-1,4-benzoquinol methylase